MKIFHFSHISSLLSLYLQHDFEPFLGVILHLNCKNFDDMNTTTSLTTQCYLLHTGTDDLNHWPKINGSTKLTVGPEKIK